MTARLIAEWGKILHRTGDQGAGMLKVSRTGLCRLYDAMQTRIDLAEADADRLAIECMNDDVNTLVDALLAHNHAFIARTGGADT